MLSHWLVRVFWRPFEAFCHWNPLVPIGLRREEVAPGVEAVFMRNAPVRFLTFVSGGYDYAVFYIVDGELFFDSGYAWAAKTLRRHLADGAGRKRSQDRQAQRFGG